MFLIFIYEVQPDLSNISAGRAKYKTKSRAGAAITPALLFY
jgi:hypothetical protein